MNEVQGFLLEDRGIRGALVRLEETWRQVVADHNYTPQVRTLLGVADSKLVDRDLMIYALKAGYGRKGAKIGSRDGDAELFKADMLAFWRRTLG